MEDQATRAYWYAVHTYSGYENKVAKEDRKSTRLNSSHRN